MGGPMGMDMWPPEPEPCCSPCALIVLGFVLLFAVAGAVVSYRMWDTWFPPEKVKTKTQNPEEMRANEACCSGTAMGIGGLALCGGLGYLYNNGGVNGLLGNEEPKGTPDGD